MKEEKFCLRFYGQTEEKIKECCERIVGATKDIKRYEIGGKTTHTMNIIAPGECREAFLIFESEAKAREFLGNAEGKRIYEEYSNATGVPSKTFVREKGDPKFSTIVV